MCIVLECCDGGELAKRIEEQKRGSLFSESKVSCLLAYLLIVRLSVPSFIRSFHYTPGTSLFIPPIPLIFIFNAGHALVCANASGTSLHAQQKGWTIFLLRNTK